MSVSLTSDYKQGVAAAERREHDPLPYDSRGAVAASLALPTLANANDVRELVQYLKKRPEGVNISEVAQPLKKRIFYPSKVTAYEYWGIAARAGERLTLTPLGWEFARCLEPEARVYRTLLDQTLPYRSALKWMGRAELDIVTQDDVISYWREYFPEAMGRDTERKAGSNAVCFFHICQAAELGTMIIGKRGQPARMHLLRHELQTFLNDDPCIPYAAAVPETGPREWAGTGEYRPCPAERVTGPTPRVFISCGARTNVVTQLSEMLDLFEVESEIIERSTTPQETPPSHLHWASRRYDAGVIIVSRADCHGEPSRGASLNEDALIEIAASYFMYRRRAIFLLEDGLAVAESFPSLPWQLFQGDRLTLEDGVRLLRVIKAASRRGDGAVVEETYARTG